MTDSDIAALANPPKMVKISVYPCVAMLGGDISSWKSVRKEMRSSHEFVKKILDFKTSQLSPKLRAQLEKEYVNTPDWDYERIGHAYQACVSLAKWIASQVKFSRVKDSVKPLQKELDRLQKDSTKLATQQNELETMVKELETKISEYKQEYHALVAETETIKKEKSVVGSKVSRAEKLLLSLSMEKQRWADDRGEFQAQMTTSVGDCLVSGAFLAYIGYFNQSFRGMLVDQWQSRLTEKGVATRENLSLINYLSHPSDQLSWKAHSLPDDQLCFENAIMMKRFNRYPLIIDPSGQATNFLMSYTPEVEKRKIVRTSFLDTAFLKHLESCLRFGNALLVEDVESIDPVLNSVLNKEIFRSGGRVMITVGDKEIDFSPTFKIFLSTRDPTCHFTPDLCSRVTFVNFTMTHSSLTSQCLSMVLKVEREDIDKKRTDLLRLQGEFQVKLRALEDQLLQSLSAVEGNILDDNKVLSSLETLKSEAQFVIQKKKESDEDLHKIMEVSLEYRGFAEACSRTYFTLEKLSGVHILYQYSLSFFLKIVKDILTSAKTLQEKDLQKRLLILTKQFFWKLFDRVARGLLQQDQVGFGLRLSQIYFTATGKNIMKEEELRYITSSKPGTIGSLVGLRELQRLGRFSNVSGHSMTKAKEWEAFSNPSFQNEEVKIPSGWEEADTDECRLWQQLLVVKAVRPDMFARHTAKFLRVAFGEGFLEQTENMNLFQVAMEAHPKSPLLLVSRVGFDPSPKVDALARRANKKIGQDYHSFAMGSPEGFAQADRAVELASKRGTWVLLKNVHLAVNWLGKLEKMLHMREAHHNFRLFLTMEMTTDMQINPKMPTNLLRLANVIIFEPPVGIKASLHRTFATLSPERVNRGPKERARLFFLLAWVHAVILERLRYAPVGWTKSFEFGESDIACAMSAIDEWTDRVAQTRANLPPKQIPWKALRALLEHVVYGGRIDNEFDQERLSAFVNGTFVKDSYSLAFPLAFAYSSENGTVKKRPLLTLPDVSDFEGFRKFVENMPDLRSPEILGLPPNAELILATNHCRQIAHELLVLQQDEAHEASMGEEEKKQDGGAGAREAFLRRRSSLTILAVSSSAQRPLWMTNVMNMTGGWEAILPKTFNVKVVEVDNPLSRSLSREAVVWNALHSTVLADIQATQEVLSGKQKADNHIRALFKVFRRDQLPEEWNQYEIGDQTVGAWVEDFAMRLNRFVDFAQVPIAKLCRQSIWLGGMYMPEAFIAATRQHVATARKLSLEALVLRVVIEGDADFKKVAASEDSFTFEQLTLFGAGYMNGHLSVSSAMAFKLPPACFEWRDRASVQLNESATAMVPVYLNETRQKFLFSVPLRCPEGVPPHVWSKRGTCLTVWYGHHLQE